MTVPDNVHEGTAKVFYPKDGPKISCTFDDVPGGHVDLPTDGCGQVALLRKGGKTRRKKKNRHGQVIVPDVRASLRALETSPIRRVLTSNEMHCLHGKSDSLIASVLWASNWVGPDKAPPMVRSHNFFIHAI